MDIDGAQRFILGKMEARLNQYIMDSEKNLILRHRN